MLSEHEVVRTGSVVRSKLYIWSTIRGVKCSDLIWADGLKQNPA